MPYLPASFGDDVRQLAISKRGIEVLPLGEKICDSHLILLGVALGIWMTKKVRCVLTQ